ncbi:MAG: rhodanese-like domain-containing protein [Verrucomicrobiae bacterium]|nr:rhodanese-like domain-containing protein [Verrucomicrobiae bacterium]
MPSRFSLWSGAILVVGMGLLAAGYYGYDKLQKLNDLPSIEAMISEDFSDVTHLSPAALADRQKTSGDDLLIIDCRKPHEYAVSHLPNAVNLRSASEVTQYLEDTGRTPQEIVAYCSVGYRSSKLARALQKDGYENVANLRGSIFAWANEDRPLENSDGTEVLTVHPYHDFWAKLLKPGKAWKRP